jgi:sugar phosphate isomerase/epimerase
MIPCISQATTLGTPFQVDLESFANAGWPAVELWLTKLETYLEAHSIADARTLLETLGIRPLAAASQGGLLLSQGAERAAHWELFCRRLGILGELGVPTLVVAVDFGFEPAQEDYGRAVASLVEAAGLAAGSGVTLAIEFQKNARFCASLDTTLALIAQAGATNLGVCLDLFHYYTGPSKFEDLGYLSPENLAWVQICDLSGTPRELAGDSDRILPGEGDFQLGPIFEHLAAIGYAGGVSLEVMNPQLWSIPVGHVATVGYQAVTRVLSQRASGVKQPAWGSS